MSCNSASAPGRCFSRYKLLNRIYEHKDKSYEWMETVSSRCRRSAAVPAFAQDAAPSLPRRPGSPSSLSFRRLRQLAPGPRPFVLRDLDALKSDLAALGSNLRAPR